MLVCLPFFPLFNGILINLCFLLLSVLVDSLLTHGSQIHKWCQGGLSWCVIKLLRRAGM
jgi:hypothetical protein